ncbi:hypothetical protein GCM10011348_03340 [Marinobacterium nitratireducens]|uniref:DUF1828 domain-containing protein n=1 Tax=Marinobacterium nitratireducens TaxID=518897 RepID=A0A917Z985_9GAMM|nr:hypothetical protein [Marinobacterium nitratireducens]GGO76349.1 hypothetical protein GCM10011348_03340 [Marinobacterium nitratireducens]
MSIKINKQSFLDAAKSDFEFTRETRYLTGIIRLDLGSDSWALTFANGEFVGVADGLNIPDEEAKVIVGGTEEQWSALLEVKPKPFYQCIQSAAVKHGMRINVANETFAYLPALNRMTTLLRQLNNQEG